MGSFPDGVLPVDKPPGPTSHDMVAQARRSLHTRRVGHTGTLDPFASGLLLLCINRATRLVPYLHDLPKEYEAVARLGQETSTLDIEGPVVRESEDWRGLDRARILEALRAFEGDLEQVPPAFSAKKVDGEAAYERARRGEEVVLPAVSVRVHRIELLALDLPFVRFRTAVSTGTYIRALARDLGTGLGVGAHLTALRRTAIGGFSVDDALPPEGLDDPVRVSEAWIDPQAAVGHLPRVDVDGEEAARLASGQRLPFPSSSRPEGSPVAIIASGRLLAVGEISGDCLRPRRVFVQE
jgi:tRNA pseudouridine55 synthase